MSETTIDVRTIPPRVLESGPDVWRVNITKVA